MSHEFTRWRKYIDLKVADFLSGTKRRNRRESRERDSGWQRHLPLEHNLKAAGYAGVTSDLQQEVTSVNSDPRQEATSVTSDPEQVMG